MVSVVIFLAQKPTMKENLAMDMFMGKEQKLLNLLILTQGNILRGEKKVWGSFKK